MASSPSTASSPSSSPWCWTQLQPTSACSRQAGGPASRASRTSTERGRCSGDEPRRFHLGGQCGAAAKSQAGSSERMSSVRCSFVASVAAPLLMAGLRWTSALSMTCPLCTAGGASCLPTRGDSMRCVSRSCSAARPRSTFLIVCASASVCQTCHVRTEVHDHELVWG